MHRIIEEIIVSSRQRKIIAGAIEDKTAEKRDFISRLKTAEARGEVPVIAEVKPASPLGDRRAVSPVQAAAMSKEMERGGAVAISVLTEHAYFNGSIENLEAVRKSVYLPVLRKDFIVSEAQIFETKADLILLIACILKGNLKHFAELARKRGMEPLIEVHSRNDIERALDADAKLIGVNNRDFETLEVDLGRTGELAPLIREKNKEAIIISESGIKNAGDVKRVICAGADGILVGSSIMSSANIEAKTRELVNLPRD